MKRPVIKMGTDFKVFKNKGHTSQEVLQRNLDLATVLPEDKQLVGFTTLLQDHNRRLEHFSAQLWK